MSYSHQNAKWQNVLIFINISLYHQCPVYLISAALTTRKDHWNYILVSVHLLLKLNATIQLLFLDQEHLSLIHLKETKKKKTNGSTP